MKDINEYLQQFDKSFGLEMQDIQDKTPSWISLGDWIKEFIKQALTERDAEFLTILEGLEMVKIPHILRCDRSPLDFSDNAERKCTCGAYRANEMVKELNHKIALIKQQLQVKEDL